MNRWALVGLVMGLLAAGVLYDRVDLAPVPDPSTVGEPVVTPALRSADRLSNVWFCPIGSGAAGGYATHQLAISNLSDAPATAAIDLVTGDGPGPGLEVAVAPFSTEVIDVAALDPAPSLGAVVEVSGGLGVVGHTVTTQGGITQGPCSTETADRWFYADGVTTRDAVAFVALLNPFPEDAVFTMTFQSPTRTREPLDLKRAVVPGGSVRVVNIGEFVTREPNVATTIVVERGQLAVERLQIFDGTLGPRGSALQLAVAEPSSQWTLPSGRVHEGGDHRLAIFNPTETVAEVDVEFDLEPVDRAAYGLVPIEVSVPPGRSVVLDLRGILTSFGLPLPYDVGLRVQSANDVPVVAERWQVTPAIDTTLIGAGGADARIVRGRQSDAEPGEVSEEDIEVAPVPAAAQPTATIGVASSRGVEVSSTRWIVPWVELGG
ncbi:MAG: hypothetical protein ACI8TP_004352, partial [Acidimicrobiales bacterium]